ncbi:MFS transporter [Rhodohalobacter sp. SW132]|uniref:MFS transporter n=1 Tax=Rhodohalobacter sp. SW132 TaxID=2293433 RepID=UPI000E2222E5|nr:MFS transporter [Rhodohalobacter sp. SW132]REL33457.1 MFS transporter [Rhodohalobacter sp. SW132]
MSEPYKDLSQNVYEFITEDDDNACAAIPDSACKEAPGNFFLNAFNGTCTKLAEQIASPGLVLPWLLSAIGAPASFSGFLVPISRGGSLLPQLAISGRIREYRRRKWFWVGAGVTQAAALLLMALMAVTLSGVWGGVVILLLLALFSMASGVGSVSFKDVLAKTIPKGKRGTLLSIRATAGGILSLGAGYWVYHYIGDGEDVGLYAILLVAAGVLWFVAALFFFMIKEEPGATGGSRTALKEATEGWGLLKEQPQFLKFIIARSLLLSVMLVIPFYSIFARDITGTEVSSLGLFVIANSLAMVLSSYFWGRFADRSSKHVMAAGGFVGVIGAAVALGFLFVPGDWQTPILFSSVFLIAGFAHAGIRMGRKTYLVDAAPEKDRPLYVAVSNTLVGFITVLSAIIGFGADIFGVEWLIALFGMLMIAGIVVSLSLPQADKMVV